MNNAAWKQAGKAGRLRQIRQNRRTEWRKTAKRAMAVLAAAVLTGTIWNPLPGTVKASEDPAPKVSLSVPDNKVLTYEYQKPQDFVIQISNTGTIDITDFTISPDLHGDDSSKWPFKTHYQNYSAKLDKLGAGESKDISFSFTERDDVSNSRYTLYFDYSFKYEKADKSIETVTDSKTFYVNTTAKPEEKPAEPPQQNQPEPQNQPEQQNQNIEKKSKKPKSGGISNSDASYSGGGGGSDGGSGSDGSVPRVIVTGFDTNPDEVRAGTDFTLTVHLKNTSKKSRVKNMLFDLSAPVEGSDEQTTAPAFLPSSGSSSVYLDGIKAGGTADISISLNAKSDLLQKPYSVELSMKYEDKNSAAVEASSSLSIPVKQDARFEFSDFEITPESISVEDEANVMCSLYNLGRIKLYNVKAVFEGSFIDKEEVFVGNVESGATASIDAMLKGTKETAGPEPITMTMSYENEEGEVFTQKKELTLEVTPPQEEEAGADMPAEEEKSGGLPIVPIVIALAVIVIVVVVIRKQRKKRLMKNEEEDLLYELDGSSEDER